jgi:hypothetical protein
MEIGSWADWVSGVSTAAAFAAALFVIFKEKRERLTERAETLGSYLMMEDIADRDRFQSISLSVVSSGRDEFRQVRLYRISEIEGPNGRQRIQLTALIPSTLPRREYTCQDVFIRSRFPLGIHQHPFSAMTFRFRGAEWITYPDEFPRKLNHFSRRRFHRKWKQARLAAPIDDVVEVGPGEWKQRPLQ